jgi:hypothetical protein
LFSVFEFILFMRLCFVVLVSTSELCSCACIGVYDSAASKKRKQSATDDDADEGGSDDTE